MNKVGSVRIKILWSFFLKMLFPPVESEEIFFLLHHLSPSPSSFPFSFSSLLPLPYSFLPASLFLLFFLLPNSTSVHQRDGFICSEGRKIEPEIELYVVMWLSIILFKRKYIYSCLSGIT
jgi:hypothetical protein